MNSMWCVHRMLISQVLKFLGFSIQYFGGREELSLIFSLRCCAAFQKEMIISTLNTVHLVSATFPQGFDSVKIYAHNLSLY